MRIVSLLPSATEALCCAGGTDLLVGRSHECDCPAPVLGLPVVTAQTTRFTDSADVDRRVRLALAAGDSLYRLDADRLRALRPDLILTQDLCAVCSIDLGEVQRIATTIDPTPTVLCVNPKGFEDVLDDIVRIGDAVGLSEGARSAVVALRENFFHAADFTNAYTAPIRTVFLEWTNPLYVGGHWTPQLIERAGGAHPLNATSPLPGAGAGAGAQMAHRSAGPSIRVEVDDMVRAAPEAIVVCPCGLDLAATRQEISAIADQTWWRELPAVRSGRVALVDGNQMFNRPGPRLVEAYRWLVGWLNDRPELIPTGFPWEAWNG